MLANQSAAGTVIEQLDRIFRPRAVALIGASRKPGSIGQQLLHNLVEYGFTGKVFPVNPNAEAVHSMKCYPTVLDIPDPVDLAIIAVPKDRVLQVVDQCGAKGVKGLVVITAGFKEVGGRGAELEKELVARIRSYGIRMIGPNCMGIINTDPEVRLNATFAPEMPEEGGVAFMSQSGALGVAILNAARRLGIGLSFFVSAGNKADISGNDLLEYWQEDKRVGVIALYLESFGNPRRFTQLARRITKSKPMVVVKSGRTAAGARAASSHTGALAGTDIAVTALLAQCGVIRAAAIEEMFDLLMGLSSCPLPRGKRVGILTNGGGPGIMATDACISMGLELAELSENTRRRLASFLPEDASLVNPVDMLPAADAPAYERAVRLLLEEPSVDMLMVIFVPPLLQQATEVALAITGAAAGSDKPVVAVFMARDEFFADFHNRYKKHPPLYRFPESAARALAELYRYSLWRSAPAGKIVRFDVDSSRAAAILEAKRRAGGGYLSADQTFAVLEAYGFPVARRRTVGTLDEALGAAREIGFPVALKVVSEKIVHKSDVGGVALDLHDEEELAQAFERMGASIERAGRGADLEGFLLQEMVRGRELILGMSLDPTFGPLLMFGLGGKYVEVLKDVAFRITPITDVDAAEMIRAIEGFPLLAGYRGEPPVDLECVVEMILRLAQLVTDFDIIVEMDINPFIFTARREGSKVVDARIKVAG